MLLRNAHLIDGTGAVHDRLDIAIAGEQISALGRSLPPQEEVWDLQGAAVIPGLINAHVHLFLDAGPDPLSTARDEPAYLILQAARRAEAMLRAGITTARDMGGIDHADLALKRAIREGLTPGPRLLVSGQLIAMTGGHGWSLGVEADGADALRRAARVQIKAGVDVVKLMATGGVMTPGVEPGAAALTEEEMRAAVEEAHKASRLTAAHAQGTLGIGNALRAGIDTIEHGIYLTEALCQEMARRQVFLVPTLAATHLILVKGEESGIPAYVVEKVRRVTEAHRNSARMAHELGVPIAMGNDAGTPFNHHDDVVTELGLLLEVGFSPMEALVAATREGARLLRLDHEIGTVEVGKQADLVVLAGNPLQDIAAVGQVRAVIQAGRKVVDRSTAGPC